jgi:hypothetical protein
VTGLDYARKRYDELAVGRFMSPEPSGYADPAESQSRGQYAYVEGDPVSLLRPGGRDHDSSWWQAGRHNLTPDHLHCVGNGQDCYHGWLAKCCSGCVKEQSGIRLPLGVKDHGCKPRE